MRILHVVRQFKPGIGGLEDYVANLSKLQSEAGHSVSIVTLNRLFTDHRNRLPVRDSVAGCNVVRIGYFGSHRYPLAPGILRQIRDCDIVHVHGVDFFFDAAAWAHLFNRHPMVASTHGGFFHTPYLARTKKLFFNTVTRMSVHAYSAVLASSVGDQRLFDAIAGDRVHLIENGVDISKFSGSASPVFRKSMVTVGRFSSNKRLDRTLALLEALRRADTDWTLTIVGTPADVGFDRLRQWVEERNLTKFVKIIQKPTDNDIAGLFGTASFFVSASEYEGFGIAAVEGLSAGLIPVLNDIPAFRRLHDRCGIGLVGDFAKPELVAERLLAAIPHIAARYQALRVAAQTTAAEYSWPTVAERIQSIYEQVLGMHQRRIFGVPVSVSTRRAAIANLDSSADAGKTTRVAFLNAHGANIARKDKRFFSSLRKCMVLNDGVGVDIASLWLYGHRFPENLNGTDFTIDYLAQTRRSYRIFLLGARPRVVTQAAVRLAARVGRHQIVGYHDGYFSADDLAEIAAKIRQSGADMLLVALGNPKQEVLIAEHLEETGCRVAFGVGALFDFISGTVPRAPAWLRACRLEWMFRLILEPRRLWKRYFLGNVAFLAGVMGRNATTGTFGGASGGRDRYRPVGYSS